jgi:UDP-N-acetyl-2-amino-2-deoxyglucuronate dehydrogenase
MNQMIYALIGCGKVAEKHLKAALAFPDALAIAALSDNRPEAATKLMRSLNFSQRQQEKIKVFADYREMLRTIKPQVVAITTPSGSHFQMGMDALDVGAHVIIEKPLTLSIDEADQLIRRAEEKQVRIVVGHIYRYFPIVAELASEIRAGRHGRVLYGDVKVRWGHDQSYYDQAAWRGTYAQDGGALMNQSIHALDLMKFLMGSDIVSAKGSIAQMVHQMEAEDFGLAILGMSDGAYCQFEGTTNTDPKRQEASFYVLTEQIEIRGGILCGKVNIAIRDRKGKNHVFSYLKRQLVSRWRESGISGIGMLFHPHTELYRDFLRSLKEERPPLADGRSGRAAVEAVLLIYKSALSGHEEHFPVAPFRISDMSRYFANQKLV